MVGHSVLISQLGASEADPQSYAEAMSGAFAKQWQEAYEHEFHTLEAMDSWDMVSLPPGRRLSDLVLCSQASMTFWVT
jgi:hypothetical protein